MSEPRNKDGLTEAEFLARYDASRYDRPSVTVDIIIINENKVLLIRRANHPSIGKLAFPGGFVEPNEPVPESALRELAEETNMKAISLKQLRCFSDPSRDPRTRIITVPFLAEVEKGASPHAGDDAADAKWYEYKREVTEAADGHISKITVFAEGKSLTVEVKTEYGGILKDARYKTLGESFFAGDHACIFACALDEYYREKDLK